MTETGVDYSAARFTAAELKAKNIVAVGRYLTGPYAITLAELSGLVAGGISVWFIFEAGVNNVAGGVAQGVVDARKVTTALATLGLPITQPVYFTIDEDLTNPAESVPYFQGIDEVRPAADTGDYAEGAVCQALEGAGLVGFNWQTESTAFAGNAVTLPITDLQQKVGGAPLANTDLDLILKSDFGQYPRPKSGPLPGGASMSDFPGAVAAELTADGSGAWVVTSNGNVYTSGDAQEYGTLTTAGVKGVTNIVGIARSWGGSGYYLWGSDGGVYAFGDAKLPSVVPASYPGLPASDRQGERSFGGGSFKLGLGGTTYKMVALDGSRYSFGA